MFVTMSRPVSGLHAGRVHPTLGGTKGYSGEPGLESVPRLSYRMCEDELSALDVAIMTNHVPMAKMLLMHGAKENTKCKLPESCLSL